jgi:hypothetical protein
MKYILLFQIRGLSESEMKPFRGKEEKKNSSLPPFYTTIHSSQSYITRNVSGYVRYWQTASVRRGQAVDDIGNNISTYRTHVNKYLPGDAKKQSMKN